MTKGSRFRTIGKSVLGVFYGLAVFLATATGWTYGSAIHFLLADWGKGALSPEAYVVEGLIRFVPLGLLSGLAFLVAWKVAGRWAGIVASLVSLAGLYAWVASLVAKGPLFQ